jgi:hypothetical protein
MRTDGLNLFNQIAFIALLSACVSNKPTEAPVAPKDAPKEPVSKYVIGDCLMLVDPTVNIWKTKHFVRVEKIDYKNKRYYYRWRLDNNKWDSGLSSTVGKFNVLERITLKIDCNSIKVRAKTSDKYM